MGTVTAPRPTAAVAVRGRRRREPLARPGLVLTLQNLLLTASPLLTVALVGQMPQQELYVRSLYQPLSYVLLAVVIGLGTTAQVATARRLGAGGRPEWSTMFRLLRAGVVATAVLVAVLWPLLGGARPGLLSFALLMTLTLPLSVAGELTAAVLRGTGAVTASTVLSATRVAVEVGLVAAVGIGAGAGLAALPIAAAVAGALEAVAGAHLLRHVLTDGDARTPVAPLLWRIGLPSAATLLLLFGVSSVLVGIAARTGPEVVAAVTIGTLVEGLLLSPAFGFGIAVGTAVNRALAAQNTVRAWQVCRRGAVLVAIGYVVITLAMLRWGSAAAPLLTSDPAARAAVGDYLGIVGPAMGATGFVLTSFVVVQQLGLGFVTLLANVTYYGVVLAVAAVFTPGGDPQRLYWILCLAAVAGVFTGTPLAWAAITRAVEQATESPRHRRSFRVR